MKRLLSGAVFMALSFQMALAQTDLHCHMIPASYLEAVKAHGLSPEDVLSNNAKTLFNIQ